MSYPKCDDVSRTINKKEKEKNMETMIQCNRCQEDMNEADWEANQHCCLHCGSKLPDPISEITQPRRFAPLKTRLEFSRVFEPVRRQAIYREARLYA